MIMESNGNTSTSKSHCHCLKTHTGSNVSSAMCCTLSNLGRSMVSIVTMNSLATSDFVTKEDRLKCRICFSLEYVVKHKKQTEMY